MTNQISYSTIKLIVILFTVLSSTQASLKGDDCSCKVNTLDDSLKIVNGTHYYNNKYPWLVSLQIQRAGGE